MSMSNNLGKAYNNDSGSFAKPSHSHQSYWMPRWTQPPKHEALIAPHSQTFCKEEGLHRNPKRMCASLNITSDVPRSSELIRAHNFSKKSSGNRPFSSVGPSTKGDSTLAPRTLMDPSCSFEANSPRARKRNRSPLLAINSADSEMQPQINLKNSRSHPTSHLSFEDDGHDPVKVMAVSTHSSNDQKYEKYSAILVHPMNSLSAIVSKNQKDPQSELFATQADAQPLEEVPCPKRGPPLFSQTATRNFLITKQMRQKTVQGSTQHGGVKIQPLYSSTDSEKDNLGCAPAPIGGRSCDLSGQTETMDTVTLSNKNDDFSGVPSSPLVKHVMRDQTFVTSSVDPQEDNIELPAPEMAYRSSADGVEPSSSQTQSLEAEHLLSSSEQPYESKFIPLNKECSAQAPSSLWVKRLKPSSSEMGESPSQEINNHSKELMISDKSMVNDESLSRKGSNSIFQCSWIQRWCQDHTGAENKNLNEGTGMGESDNSKLLFDELEKKQFPSIAAMAMMGKSMNGFRPCKFTKRGSLVVWNTEDY